MSICLSDHQEAKPLRLLKLCLLIIMPIEHCAYLIFFWTLPHYYSAFALGAYNLVAFERHWQEVTEITRQ